MLEEGPMPADSASHTGTPLNARTCTAPVPQALPGAGHRPARQHCLQCVLRLHRVWRRVPHRQWDQLHRHHRLPQLRHR
eukprot:56826-Chlamydomonas_euryale.AAC.1